MPTKKVRYAQPLLGEANALGYLIAVPGAAVQIRQNGVECDVFADNDGTAMTNPVPTGVPVGTAGVDVRGTLLVYLNPGSGYDGVATVGTEASTFPIPDISPDVSDVATPAAIDALQASVDTKADATTTAAAIANKADAAAAADLAETNARIAAIEAEETARIAGDDALTLALAGKEPSIPPGTYVDVPAVAGVNGQQVLVPDSSLDEGVRWAFLSAAGLAINVLDYANGANIRDGVTDAAPAITLAIAAAQAAGGQAVYFPPGIYAIATDVLLTASSVVFKGAGRWSSTIKHLVAGARFLSTGSAKRQNIVFEDLAFDGQALVNNSINVVSDNIAGEVRVTRCRFWRCPVGITASGLAGLTVEDTLFHTDGTGLNTGVLVGTGIRRLTVRRNVSLWQASLLSVDTGTGTGQNEEISEYVNIHDNYVDGAWWLLTELFAGEGGTVSYTATVLTDTAANFSGISQFDIVRAMTVAQASSATVAYSRTKVTDTSATFIANGVERGHIIKAAGGKWAVVASVQSETVLWVEEWLTEADRLPAHPPAANTAFTVYSLAFGKVASSTATTVTVTRWFNFLGATVTPAAGTRYEVTRHGAHAFNVEYSARSFSVSRNTCRRGWGDQIAVRSYRSQIIDNLVEDGLDMGITAWGQHNVISGNIVNHQGAGGIWCSSDNSVVKGNVVTDTTWENNTNVVSLAGIILFGCNGTLVEGNLVENLSMVNGRYGIAITDTSDGNTLRGNRCLGHTTGDIRLDGAAVTNTRGDFLHGTTWSSDSAQAPRGTFRGTGSPNGAVTAGTGSTFHRSDGAAGTALYVKETGTANTGWVNIVSGDATDLWLPTGANAQTFSRVGLSNQSILTSGQLTLVLVELIEGQTITSITFASATTAAVTPANQWFALYALDRTLLRVTSDDTTTAWAANTRKTLALASAYVVPTSGLYYFGIMVNAATVPTLAGLTGLVVSHGVAPIVTGVDATNTGLTTPASAPSPAAAITARGAVPWAYAA